MIQLLHGDCLEAMQDIPDESIDMILCDPPYGTTQCSWDTVIPFAPMWKQYRRIVKKNGAILLFGSEPFASQLRVSNLKHFRYDWIWEKDKPTGHLNAKRQPLRIAENIVVFYERQCTYNPQYYPKAEKDIRPATKRRGSTPVYGDMTKNSEREIPDALGYPKQILRYPAQFGRKGLSFHPTQKPVELAEYLIRTYTNEGETVLDNCMGSGTTGVACINTDRNFIGIEKKETYFNIARQRIAEAQLRGML